MGMDGQSTKPLIGIGICVVLSVLARGYATAQSSDPAADARARLATQHANEKLAWAYYRPGNTIDQRLAYISPKFVNHNLGMERFMALNKIATSKEGFRIMVETRAKLLGDPNTGTNGPAAQPYEVMASGDLVAIVHEHQQADPANPVETRAVYQYDLFRIENGKFVEHWDGTPLPQPLPTLLSMPISQMHFPQLPPK
jgi:hypothetical protein